LANIRSSLGRRRLLAVPVAAALGIAGLATTSADAAKPGGGTISPNAPTFKWQGKNYTAMGNPDRETCPSKERDPNNLLCDHFILTVDVEPSYYKTHTGGAVVRISAGDGDDDFDLFVYQNGTLVASDADADSDEKVIIDEASGVYEVRVSPFLVTNSGYNGTAKFVSQAGAPTAPPLGRAWKYHGTRITGDLPKTEPQNRPTTDNPNLPPLMLKWYNVGRQAAEPTIAIDRTPHIDPTTGNKIKGYAFYAAATFDRLGRLADTRIRRSPSEGRTWQDKTPQPDLPITLDPYVYVEEDSNRVFNADLYVGSTYLQFSDKGGAPNSYTTNLIGSGPTDLGNDHQTIFAGPRPKQAVPGLLPATDPKFPEIMYYCYNNIASTKCSRSTDGGRVFVSTGEVAYPGIKPSTGQFCGGLSGHVRTDPGGRVFVPREYCSVPTVSISENAGTTWKRVAVSKTVLMDDDHSSMYSDQKGNLYYTWTDKKFRLPWLATSTNHGFTWSKPLMIAPPNVREAAGFSPAISAGSNGRIAISFPGTTSSNEGDLSRPWDFYVLYSKNALSANPTFVSNIANPATDPVHRGNCPGRCGNMLDFLDIQISPAPGHAIWATAVDTCTSLKNCKTNPDAVGFNGRDNDAADMQGMVARQIGGAPDLGPPGGCSRTCGQ